MATAAVLLSGCANQLSAEKLRVGAGLEPASAVVRSDPAAGGTAVDAPAGPVAAPPRSTMAAGRTAAPDAGGPGAPTVAKVGAPAGSTKSTGAATRSPVNGLPQGVPAAQPACTGPKPPIVIGTVGEQSGPLGAALIGGVRAVQAWVAAQNAAGGLACHPVKYIVSDDGGDPSRHLSLVRKLVEQDGVIAIVFQDALLTGQASKDYVVQKGIPVIGQDGGENQTYDAPNYFNHAVSAAPLFDMTVIAGGKVALPAGKKNLGTLVCQEVAGCGTAGQRFTERGRAIGFNVVYSGQASLLNVDFTAPCLSAQRAKVDVLAVSFESTGIHRIADSCARVGYHPLIVCTSVQSTLDFASDPNLRGAVVAQPLLPWFLADRVPIREYQATLKRYSPDTAFDSSSINGWGAAKLFEQAKAAFAADRVTSAGIIDALSRVRQNDLDGLTYPLSFAVGQPQVPEPCGWVVRVGDGTFTSDGRRFCG